jgi:hypothetical protein
MKKIVPIVLAGVGFASFYFVFNNVEAQIKAAAEEINKDLPKTLNPYTRYESMLVDGRKVNHIYTLTQVTADEVDDAQLKMGYDVLLKSLCNDEDSRNYLDQDVTFSFTYKDKVGKFVRVFSVTKDECPSA